MAKRTFKTIFTALYICTILSAPALGEAFGNNAVTVPKFGMAFFDTALRLHRKPWGLSHQWTIGTSFSQAIDYRWWWVADTQIGFGSLSQNSAQNIATILGGAGLRFNIFVDDFRPHLGLMIHYLHFLGAAASAIPLNVDWPIFVGLKPYFGMEWLFYSEMSLSLEGGYGFYLNINEPFRHALYANISYSFYF